MERIIFILFILLSSLSAQAQNALLQSFSAQQQENDVLITWVIGKGSQCADVQVQHSADSINFDPVYTYPGICGSNSDAATYYWTHSEPLQNKKNYYRIYIPTSGYSSVITVHHHSFESSAYVAAPNPSSGNINIYFKNPQSSPHTLMLFDIHGRMVQSITGITSSEILIDRALLRSGTYFFRLFEEGASPITGKIVFIN